MGGKAALLVALLFLSLALETQADSGGHPTPLTTSHRKKPPRRPPSPPKHRPRPPITPPPKHRPGPPTPPTPTPPPYTPSPPSPPEPTPPLYSPAPPSPFLEHGGEADYAGVQAAAAIDAGLQAQSLGL